VYFAVRGGLSSAASAIAITALFIPPSATFLGFEGERISLQFLLLIACGFSLMIGAAITDRKQAYLALKASEESLEQQVIERTQELTEAYEFQRHLMRSIGHDLRQPIQALNMMLDGLVIQHKGAPNVEPLQQARGIGKIASGFITKVLDYAKRDAGKIDILTENFAIQRVLDLVNQTFEPEAKQRGIGLHVQPTNLRMTSDPHLLWEALSNLVQNSLRLSQKGQAVLVSVQQAGSTIVISVEDQIEVSTTVNGTAGFGLQIVGQVARLLSADFVIEPNKAKLAFAKTGTERLV
jgi:signal transduction histidine kinase